MKYWNWKLIFQIRRFFLLRCCCWYWTKFGTAPNDAAVFNRNFVLSNWTFSLPAPQVFHLDAVSSVWVLFFFCVQILHCQSLLAMTGPICTIIEPDLWIKLCLHRWRLGWKIRLQPGEIARLVIWKMRWSLCSSSSSRFFFKCHSFVFMPLGPFMNWIRCALVVRRIGVFCCCLFTESNWIDRQRHTLSGMQQSLLCSWCICCCTLLYLLLSIERIHKLWSEHWYSAKIWGPCREK